MKGQKSNLACFFVLCAVFLHLGRPVSVLHDAVMFLAGQAVLTLCFIFRIFYSLPSASSSGSGDAPGMT